MNNKKRKIVGISQTPNFFNLDIRISIPKNHISQEMVNDLIENQNYLIQDGGNAISWVKITQDDEGNDLLEFGNDLFYGVE